VSQPDGPTLVSIRASLQQRGERRLAPVVDPTIEFQSAPHFSSEANTKNAFPRRPYKTFQSAPHFSSEANIWKKAMKLRLLSFNPRLTSAARRTLISLGRRL